jgi:hypothetical protein
VKLSFTRRINKVIFKAKRKNQEKRKIKRKALRRNSLKAILFKAFLIRGAKF